MFIPTRPDAHFGAATRNDVHRRGHLGQIDRVPIRHARTHLPEPDPVGDGGEPGHQRPRLMSGVLGRFWDGVEMVVHPGGIPRAGIDPLDQRGHRGPLLGGLDTNQVHLPALRDEHPKLHRQLLHLNSNPPNPGVAWHRAPRPGDPLPDELTRPQSVRESPGGSVTRRGWRTGRPPG
jgi:hypothetical protein